MRLVHVGSGASAHVVARAAAFAARGHAVRLVTLGPVLSPPPHLEVRTRALPRDPLAAVRAARTFLRDIHDFAPDLMHLHYAGSKLGTMATLAGVRPLVVTVMGGDVLPEQHPGGLSRLERRATRRILEQADAILVKSERLRVALGDFGAFPAPVTTVRWGVDQTVWRRDEPAAAALRARLGLAASDRVVLSPRHLRALYNVHLIVEAFASVRAAVPEAVLLVAEHNLDEGYKQALLARVGELGLGPRVRFLGRVEPPQMPALYSLAEVMVSAASSDGLPQTLFEAMGCGTPAVLARLPAYAEVVSDGESALLADLEPAALAGAVVRVLRDRGLAARLSEAARARVGEVASLSRDLGRVEAVYEEVLGRARGQRPWWPRALDALSLFAR